MMPAVTLIRTCSVFLPALQGALVELVLVGDMEPIPFLVRSHDPRAQIVTMVKVESWRGKQLQALAPGSEVIEPTGLFTWPYPSAGLSYTVP